MKKPVLLAIAVLFLSFHLFGQSHPAPHRLSLTPYYFSEWSASESAGSYPSSVVFHQYDAGSDPGLNTTPVSDWKCRYDIDSRSRIVGLGDSGVGFINTGSEQDAESRCGNMEERGGRVGAAVLALDTREMEDIELQWTVRLISRGDGYPEPREYRIRTQYRVDSLGTWTDLPASTEFTSLGKKEGDFASYTVSLPVACNDQPYVQVRWKYYQQSGNDGGTRPLLALDDIKVLGVNIVTGQQPTVFVSRSELNYLGCNDGGISQVASFEVEGRFLTGNIRIRSQGNFAISLDPAAGFRDDVTLTARNGSVQAQRVYVRYTCNEPGSVRDSIIVSSEKVPDHYIAVTGETYPRLFINELVASNFSTLYDPVSDEYPDWIEIYNPNPYPVDISGFYISDKETDSRKTALKDTSMHIIPAQGYIVFYADGLAHLGPRHLNFSLSATGEFISLYGRDGQTVIDSLSFGNQVSDVSFGREFDGYSNWVFFSAPTPGASNNTAESFAGKSDPPVFSHKGGFYKETFFLGLSAASPGASIYYTLDGSEPDPENLGGTTYYYKNNYPRHPEIPFGELMEKSYKSYVYNVPIDLKQYRVKGENEWLTFIATTFAALPEFPKKLKDHGTVVRAMVVEPGKIPSNIVTHTYFFNEEGKKQTELPIISLTTQPDKFFDYYKGIYVPGVDFDNWRMENPEASTRATSPANYSRSGREWEVPGNIEVIENAQSVLSEGVGFRIHGNYSRTQCTKSIRVYARSVYGKDNISYPFIPSLAYSDFRRMILRNSGNDCIVTFMKDAMIQSLVEFSPMDVQGYYPYNIYLNGEYWGMLNARERQDIYYFNRKYGFEDDNIDLLSNNAVVEQGSNEEYLNMMAFIRSSDMNDSANYEKVKTWMDVENYIDFYILKIYAAALDWPHNNIKYWRYKRAEYTPAAPYGLDGRWRWVNFDNDSGFEKRNIGHNTLQWAMNPTGNGKGAWSTELFRSLMSGERFRLLFIARISDLLNTVYHKDRVGDQIDIIKGRINNDFQGFMERWRRPISDFFWGRNVDVLQEFASVRPDSVRNHLRTELGLSALSRITLDVDDYQKGYIHLNTIDISETTPGVEGYPWEGLYFTRLPMTLIGVPREGYAFSHWEIADSISYTDTLQFSFGKALKAKAFFVPDTAYRYEPAPHVLASCAYHFTQWEPDQGIGTYPDNIAFAVTRYPDSRVNGTFERLLENVAYNYDSKTRINGLGNRGLSFINATTANDNYPETRLGAMILGLNTAGVPSATLSFTAGTVKANSKKYNLRLQYRIGDQGKINDLTDQHGNYIEYTGSSVDGHEERFQIDLPEALLNKPYVQLIWRYYYNGIQVNPSSNARDEIRIDDILIKQKPVEQRIDVSEYEVTLVGNRNSESYQWYTCVNDTLTAIENATSDRLSIVEPGYYALAVDYGECTDTSDCEYIFVKRHLRFAASVRSAVVPNPATDFFRIIFDEEVDDVEVSITDAAGRQITGRRYGATREASFNTAGWPTGIYMIKISTRDGRSAYHKLMKQ